jgi:hypothetical protein
LRKRFRDCVTIFNGLADNTIGGYLDQYVTIQSVHRHQFASGIIEVEAYFLAQFSDNPHFDPGQEGKDYYVSVNGTLGKVWGTGKWRDTNNTNGKDEKVKFDFIFTCNGGEWLLLSGVAK